MSVAVVAVIAGCGGGSGGGSTTDGSTPPDVLRVRVDGSGYSGLRLDLSCGVADRDVCAEVLSALDDASAPTTCRPLPPDPSRILVSGTIDGRAVTVVLPRRSDCEALAYDRVLDLLGL